MASANRRAARSSRSRCGLSLGMIAIPSGSSASKISALASAIASSDPESLDVRRSNRRDQRHVRPDQLRQRSDLPGIVHAHLEHRELRLARHAREAQRNTRMVVVALDRAVDRAGPAAIERRVQRLLGAGLADRSRSLRRSARSSARAPRARGPAERAHGSSTSTCGPSTACDTIAPAAPAAKACATNR